MDRELRVVEEDGSESVLRGVDHPDWDGLDSPCPDCGARRFRHFEARAGRYDTRDGAVVRTSDYWDADRPLFTQCLNCRLVLYRHPAVDLLYDLPTGDY